MHCLTVPTKFAVDLIFEFIIIFYDFECLRKKIENATYFLCLFDKEQ